MVSTQTHFKEAEIWFSRKATFRIPTETRGDVYMCVARTNYCNDERYVVEVDAKRFLALWKQSPRFLNDWSEPEYDEDAEGAKGWFARKYAEAERCFLLGIENPVPLAEAHCNVYRERVPIYSRNFFGLKRIDHYEERDVPPHVAFTNGITRTLWLLHNGARAFPVGCDRHTAQRMQECAGLLGGSCMTVDQLLPRNDRTYSH